MNQAMKMDTPNGIKSDFITSWDDCRSVVHPLEQMGSDGVFERYATLAKNSFTVLLSPPISKRE